MALPAITGTQPKKVHDFYETLLYNVQSLETLGKLREINGYVRTTLDKLEGIRGDLVRNDNDWQEWDFAKLIEALRLWTGRNPIPHKDSDGKHDSKQVRRSEKSSWSRDRAYQAKQAETKRGCVYCESPNHRSKYCDKVVLASDRRKFLQEKHLCFNCAGSRHRAAECKSKSTCANCDRKHHTSICDKPSSHLLTTPGVGSPVVHPVVIVDVQGVKCLALVDTGAASSYASTGLLERIKARPTESGVRSIETLMGTTTRGMHTFRIKIGAVDVGFELEADVTKIHKYQLLSLPNPNYDQLVAKYQHLDGVVIEDKDAKERLPIHLILGVGEYAKIKTSCGQRVGEPGQPVAELTKFGWTLLSPGQDVDLSRMFLTQTSSADYEELCRMDVLGLPDSPVGDQEVVYDEFKEQLRRSPEGWYETGLPWKGNHPPFGTNEANSLRRLQTLVAKLKNTGKLGEYDSINKNQLAEGVVEPVPATIEGKEFYIPHKGVFHEEAESTKLRIVYDASARSSKDSPSLNECLEVGPPLQNQLWTVLIRGRFHPVCLSGDLRKAFLQVRIHSKDRDVLRFHWLKDVNADEVQKLQFTRALFGLTSSPFLLGGVIREHLDTWRPVYPTVVEEIERSIYVDDLVSGSTTTEKALEVKAKAMEIFHDAAFELHKWHSNASGLETPSPTGREDETYAKQQLGVPAEGRCKLLGLNFPPQKFESTKRGILSYVARIYDPLGLVSPITLAGKLLYHEACNLKIPWDAPLPESLAKRCERWVNEQPICATVPWSLAGNCEEIQEIKLHAFGDASSKGVAAVVYAVVSQPSGETQGLVTAKSRLAKQGLTIPRTELVSGHMAANLVDSVKEALKGFPVTEVTGWLDSTVALCWIVVQTVCAKSCTQDSREELNQLEARAHRSKPCRCRELGSDNTC